MNEKIKKVKDILKEQGPTAGSTAMGATAGVVIGTAIAPEAHAEPEPEPIPVPPGPTPTPPPGPGPTPEPPTPPTPNPGPTPDPLTPPTPEPPVHIIPIDEIEVLAYERVTNDDGSQLDIAVVNEEGFETAYVDVNLDGIADLKIQDINMDGEIQDTEAQMLTDQNLSMMPLQDAAGFNPLYAQNDIPDYVNDADVSGDAYMA